MKLFTIKSFGPSPLERGWGGAAFNRSTILLLLFVTVLASCAHQKTLFESLPSSQTGIDFINNVEENDKYNVLDYMNIYTGAGVASGDVNNDGLVDLYFSGNENS